MAHTMKSRQPEKADSSKNGGKTNKFMTNSLWLAVSIVIVCSLMLIALCGVACDRYVRAHAHHALFHVETRQKCVKCDEDRYTATDRDAEQACCVTEARINDSIAKILGDTITEIKRENLKKSEEAVISPSNPEHFMTKSKVSAHVIGAFDNRRDRKKSMLQTSRVCCWNPDHHMSFLKNGVGFRQNRLIIPVAGFYHIYSEMRFTHRYFPLESPQNGSAVKTYVSERPFSHRIYRYNVRYPNTNNELLLQSTNTKSSNRDRFLSELSSHVGGSVHLRTGDEVFVVVSGGNALPYTSPLVNNFGLFEL